MRLGLLKCHTYRLQTRLDMIPCCYTVLHGIPSYIFVALPKHEDDTAVAESDAVFVTRAGDLCYRCKVIRHFGNSQ